MQLFLVVGSGFAQARFEILQILEVADVAHKPEAARDRAQIGAQLFAPLFNSLARRHGDLSRAAREYLIGIENHFKAVFFELVGERRLRGDRIDFAVAQHVGMGGVIPIAENLIVDPFDIFFRIDARRLQRIVNENRGESLFFPRANAAAAHIFDRFRTVPFEQGRIAPAADDVNVFALAALIDRRLDVHRRRDIHPAHFHRHGEAIAFEWAGNYPAGIVDVRR